MPETIIESVLTGKLESTLLIKWLNDECIEDTPEDCILFCCDRNEFVGNFLTYLRNQTDSILQTNSNAIQVLQHSTPEKFLSSQRKHHRSISDPTSEDRTADSLSVKSDGQRSHESPSIDKKRMGRRVKTKLLFDDKKDLNQSVSSDESRLSTGVDTLVLSSTPMKNDLKLTDYPNLASPVTPHSKSLREYERCDTPRISHRHSRSQEKSCLGDYIVTATKSSTKSKKKSTKNTSNETDESKGNLDLSNSDMFPEIGARKSSSLRTEKRRVKPTNIDKSQKSVSLNSFNSECFQQPSPFSLEDNVAFTHTNIQPKESANSFEAERNILKQERHKLMEKFNILSSSSPKAVVMPQIKITQKDSIERSLNYIKVEANKIIMKEKIDILIEIYNVLLENNLILSMTTEIYFLISILISKQSEDDNLTTESQLKENNVEFLLRSIHNSTYFAVKSLWNQRTILEMILDKNSLKTLGENKKVRNFYPDLAKFLLNCYGLKCEAESNTGKPRNIQDLRPSNGIVCFNSETDNAENFHTLLSFQNFKKQRDMFYEILRWYQEAKSGVSRTTFRARIKTLISCGPTASNHAHLAALFTAHMLAECLPPYTQESKLSQLQRRLTCRTAPESHRLPYFTDKETFYKEFIIHAENEPFRVHLRDNLTSEIVVLDSTHLTTDDRTGSNAVDITKEYLQLCKKLALLAKFLGFLTSLPYSQVPVDMMKSTVARDQSEQKNVVPKDKILETSLALRNHCQPTIDLISLLINAYENGRISITLPWIVHYLSMTDYTTIRTKYYQNLLKILFDIYLNKLKLNTENGFKRNTKIFLKSILGWLFDLPHFPQDLFYGKNRLNSSVASDLNIDSCDLVDESIILELCPHLKDVNVLLSTCRMSQEQKEIGSHRYITPVSLTLNPEDRIRNKENELQARLEQELLKSQPSSTRRVVELVIERVTSACVKELTVKTLNDAREAARQHARRLVRDRAGDDIASLRQQLQEVYRRQLQRARDSARAAAAPLARARAAAALAALLAPAPAHCPPGPGSSQPLVAPVVRACTARLAKWMDDHWTSTAVLCKDIDAELKTLLALADVPILPTSNTVVDVNAMLVPETQFHRDNVSPSACIISMKEQICLLLEDKEPTVDMSALLATCATSCSPNNLFSRPPTQRAMLQLSVDLCVVFVSRKPQEVTDGFLTKLHMIWNTCCPERKKNVPEELTLPERRADLSPQFRNFDDEDTCHTPISDEESDSKATKSVVNGNSEVKIIVNDTKPTVNGIVKTVSSEVKESAIVFDENNSYLEFFDRILCPRNIVLLSASKCKASDVWEALATVLVFLLKNDYLSEDSLTEQCLAVYRQDWPQSILESLSTCMKAVSSRWSRTSVGKFTLFLDFLAEYCGDMDYEPAG